MNALGSGQSACPACGGPLSCEPVWGGGIGGGPTPSYRFWCKRCGDPVPAARISIVRAFAPGDVVIIESDRQYGHEERLQFRKLFDEAYADTGIKFVLLDRGMRVAAREEKPA